MSFCGEDDFDSFFDFIFTKWENEENQIEFLHYLISNPQTESFSFKYYKGKRKKQVIYASVAGNLCLEQDMLTWRKIKFDFVPQKGDWLVYFNTAGYQMDSNESEFHKIPLVKKIIVEKDDAGYLIKEDKEYDCE